MGCLIVVHGRSPVRGLITEWIGANASDLEDVTGTTPPDDGNACAGKKAEKTLKKAVKPVASKQKQPMSVRAYEQICQKIITLEYGPGQILEERQLTANLGLGRTPVREALLRLAGEGWVELQPNRGAVVPSITLQGTKAIFEAMKILEVGIAGLAVGQNTTPFLPLMASENERLKAAAENGDVLGLVEANHDFHLHFAQCCKNQYLLRAMTEVRNHAKRITYLSFANEMEPERSLHVLYDVIAKEHEEIIAALTEKNETRLKEMIIEHINTFQQRIVGYMTS